MDTITPDEPVIVNNGVSAFQSEPLLQKFSHLYGQICLYAPDAPADQWGALPWRFTTEKGQPGVQDGKAMDLIIKPGAETFDTVWHHTSLINSLQLWPSI